MIDLLWDFFEIIINFYQGFIITYFAYQFLGDFRGRKFCSSPGPLYAVLFSMLVCFFNKITFYENVLAVFYVLVIFIYSLRNLYGNIISKLFASVFPMLITLVSAAFVGNLAAAIFDVPLEIILSQNTFERFIALLSTQVMIAYFMFIFLKIGQTRQKNGDELEVKEWLIISVVFVISIAIGGFLNYISLDMITGNGRMSVAAIVFGLILINASVCYLIFDLSQKNKAIRENEILKIENEYNRQYVEEMKAEYELIRKMRHDFKDSCFAIKAYLDTGDSDGAKAYLNDYVGEMSEREVYVKTDNEIVNAVINTKLTDAKAYGISVRCLCISSFEGISDIDICRLLSNIIDNAVTGCRECHRTDKQIYIKITVDEYAYYIVVKNTVDEAVLKNNPKLLSVKKEDGHGYGIKIIKDIAEKYNGRCDFYDSDDMFCCSVILRK